MRRDNLEVETKIKSESLIELRKRIFESNIDHAKDVNNAINSAFERGMLQKEVASQLGLKSYTDLRYRRFPARQTEFPIVTSGDLSWSTITALMNEADISRDDILHGYFKDRSGVEHQIEMGFIEDSVPLRRVVRLIK